MAAINTINSARLSNIAGRDQITSFEMAQRRQERDQLEAILRQIDEMSLQPAKSLLAACKRKLENQAYLTGGTAPDQQDWVVIRAIEARIEDLERCALLRRKFH